MYLLSTQAKSHVHVKRISFVVISVAPQTLLLIALIEPMLIMRVVATHIIVRVRAFIAKYHCRATNAYFA